MTACEKANTKIDLQLSAKGGTSHLLYGVCHGFDDENWIDEGMCGKANLTCAVEFPILSHFLELKDQQ